MTVVGVVGDQASAYAGTFQSLSDIAPVFRYLFAACTVIGVLVAVYKAVQLAKGSEASAPSPSGLAAGNDNLVSGNVDMVPGAVFELPTGTVIQAATEVDRRIVAIHETPLPEADPVIAAGDEGPVPATVEQAA